MARENSKLKKVLAEQIPDTAISGRRVARELTGLIKRRSKPGMIVSGNGTELTSNAILKRCADRKVEWHHIAPGDRSPRTEGRK